MGASYSKSDNITKTDFFNFIDAKTKENYKEIYSKRLVDAGVVKLYEVKILYSDELMKEALEDDVRSELRKRYGDDFKLIQKMGKRAKDFIKNHDEYKECVEVFIKIKEKK